MATPAGWFHRSCVHEIPNGAHLDTRTGVVTRRDGSTFQIPMKCGYPAYPDYPTRVGRHPWEATPADTGWIEAATDSLGASGDYAHLSTHWIVPSEPSGTYSGVQAFYSFPGLENIDQDTVYILQPVIQFGYNSYFGGPYWTAASWRCDGESGSCEHGTPISIYHADLVYGFVDASACVGGMCTWTTVMVDSTLGTRSNWTATDTQYYNWSAGGAIEVRGGPGPGFTTCDQFPDTGVYYSGVSLYDANWNQFSPNWAHYVQPNLSPSCGFNVRSTSTTVGVFYNQAPPPSLNVAINGPTEMQPNSQCYYGSTVSGGTGTYSYEWRQDGTPVGTESSVTVSSSGYVSSFYLRLDVSDTGGAQGSEQITVQITDSAPVCRFSPAPS